MTHWNSYHENLIKKWSAMSKTYSIMHSMSSEYYNNWDKRLGIPVILLGAAATSSIFTTSGETDNIWVYVNGGLVLLMTGISGISKFLGTTEKLAKHTSAAFKYTEISMNIDTVLSFPRNDREEKPREFINLIKTNILELREHSPDLPTWVISSYITKLDKSLVSTVTKINRSEKLNNYDDLKKINNWKSGIAIEQINIVSENQTQLDQSSDKTVSENQTNVDNKLEDIKQEDTKNYSTEDCKLTSLDTEDDLYRCKQLEIISYKLEKHYNSDQDVDK